MDYDHILKVLICGNAHVGKTCLMNKYCSDYYPENYGSTIGVDFKTRTVVLGNNKKVKVQIWDTAGQERFYSIVKSYYRGAHIALVCFDLTNHLTFCKVTKWIEDIKRHGNEFTQIVLVGTKLDQDYYRVVDRQSAEKIAESYVIPYVEISSKDMDKDTLHKLLLEDVLVKITSHPELYGLIPYRYVVENNVNKKKCC